MKYKQNTNCNNNAWEIGREIYKNGPPEGGPTPRDKEKQKAEQSPEKRKQEFALGEHEVLTQDKVSKDYVTQISGSVDIVGYSKEVKSTAFYRTEVIAPCELLLRLYRQNRDLFTDSARAYIEENMPILTVISSEKPMDHKSFLKLASRFSENQIYGPDGVLNLLLAFNRVGSKLEPGALTVMGDPRERQLFKIDLHKRRTRSVEVSLYRPEIKEPNIETVKLDIPGLETIKLMKPDGTYEVQYWENNKAFTALSGKVYPAQRNLAWTLQIDPKTRNVNITQYWRSPGPKSVVLTFTQFDAKAKAHAYFLHGLQ